MALNIGDVVIGKAFVADEQIGEAYVGDVLVYRAESDPITLTGTVTQAAHSMNWGYFDYTITEDWDTMTILDSRWGKSFGEFQTVIYLIDGNQQTTLVSQHGAYGGYPMENERIVANGTKYAVKKGQIIRLAVGASYNPDVSGRHETTSWLTFKLS